MEGLRWPESILYRLRRDRIGDNRGVDIMDVLGWYHPRAGQGFWRRVRWVVPRAGDARQVLTRVGEGFY